MGLRRRLDDRWCTRRIHRGDPANLAAIAVPDNRGGALSSVLCFRFVGHGLGPLLWVPMFAWSPSWTFVIASGLGLSLSPHSPHRRS